MTTPFHDKNGDYLRVGDRVQAHDKTGRTWEGTIIVVDPRKILRSSGDRNPKFAFKSNYETWINNQAYASTLEIIK